MEIRKKCTHVMWNNRREDIQARNHQGGQDEQVK